jgi:hypothetical protein
MNEQPYQHFSGNGTKFSCLRCDFKFPVKVRKPKGISEEAYTRDVAEMISNHVLTIWKQLNGFSGYDTIQFEIYEV